MVNPFLEERGVGVAKTASPTEGLGQKLDSLYRDVEASGTESLDREFAKSRSQAIDEEAVLGRLRSPVSAAAGSPMGQIDDRKAQSLSSFIGELRRSRAGDEVDVAKTLEGLKQNESQFGRTLGLERRQLQETQRQFDSNLGLQKQGMRLSELLGRMQADAKKPGTLDYLNTAFQGVTAAASAASAAKGIK
jgi:hypothetical protein